MNTTVRALSGWVLAGLLAAGAGALALWYQSAGGASAPATGTDAVQFALRKGKPMVVQFGANACAACREMKPILAALSNQYGDRIEVLDVDAIRHRSYLAAYRVQAMPTQVFFDASGRETSRNMGTIGATEILERLRISH